LLVAVVAVVAAAGWAVSTRWSGTPQTRVLGTTYKNKDFTMSGSVAGLYPGAVKPLPVTLTNESNFPIRVTVAPVTVEDANTGCTADNIRVTVPAGATEVPKNGTATVALTVRMRNSPPNACKNATFPLTYTGTATK
jgi:hypothetical protein